MRGLCDQYSASCEWFCDNSGARAAQPDPVNGPAVRLMFQAVLTGPSVDPAVLRQSNFLEWRQGLQDGRYPGSAVFMSNFTSPNFGSVYVSAAQWNYPNLAPQGSMGNSPGLGGGQFSPGSGFSPGMGSNSPMFSPGAGFSPNMGYSPPNNPAQAAAALAALAAPILPEPYLNVKLK
ncbi:hypothetical protein WJX72_000017 [[Myrmecia] bisecta]|uniref:Uncharacterized protein n=1 Tax=[Myrmecia] bisecta TaxID=41462 RepID=A0AAW1Q6T4_9CHLO